MSERGDTSGELGAVPQRAGVVFINVWNCRAEVMRYYATGGADILTGDDEIAAEYAANCDELLGDAAAAVAAQGGAINLSGLYHCPAELAARARWGISEEYKRHGQEWGH